MIPQPSSAVGSPPSNPAKSARSASRIKEWLIQALCLLCAMVSIVTTAGIIAVLAREAYEFFTKVSPVEFYTGTKWAPTFSDKHFGVLPLISGTLMITFGAALIAVPLGLLSAIYLSEYAPRKVRNVLKPVLEILAGIPTIVYGYFALFTITPFLRKIIPDVEIYNALSGMIVVGIMILPLVSSLCEDALAAVPKSMREGAFGLGATKLEVTWKIVTPAALSGIMASVILALSRAIGETMAVTLAAGQMPSLTWDPRESIQTMTAYIVQISKGDTPAGSVGYQTIFAVGVTLFAMTMILNVFAARLVKRFRQVYN
ncbi:MAG: phosphate ABC transporter permease subunit PstC [Fimbriimonadaceae bacterium]